MSKAELLQHVWDPSDERDANVVEVYIGYLRRKLDRPGERSHIDTVRSAGYRLSAERWPRPAGRAMVRRLRHLFVGVRLRVTAAAVLAVACAFGVSAAVVEVTLQHDRHNVLMATARVQARRSAPSTRPFDRPSTLPPTPSLQSGLIQVLYDGRVRGGQPLLASERPACGCRATR